MCSSFNRMSGFNSFRTRVHLYGAFVGLMAIFFGCGDQNHDVVVPNYFFVSSSTVQLHIGEHANVVLTGGVHPYHISGPPKANIASVVMIDDTIRVTGVGMGGSTVRLEDSQATPQTQSVAITVL